MLTTAEIQKKPRKNYWLFLAAAIVGIAFFSSLFLLKGNDVKTIDASSSSVAETEFAPAAKQSDSADGSEVQMAGAAPSDKTVMPPENSTSSQPGKSKPMLAVNQSMEKMIEPNPQPELESPIAERPVHKQSLNENGDISESLLAAIKSKTETQKTSVIKVDARSLLQVVDKEPELTKSQRFLRAVQNVKVAVENRNLEENH
jgi:hypothetical protein